MPVRKKTETQEIIIPEITKAQVSVNIVGTSPLIINSITDKAKRELLLPVSKSEKIKSSEPKHDPYTEFQNAPYTLKKGPTLLAMPALAIKKAMMTAALDIPSTSKSAIGRLVYVVGDMLNVYGVPEMLISVVRLAGIERTPDIRTRVIVPRWACIGIKIEFVTPFIKPNSIFNLVYAAGNTAGIGDWRPEKGSGSYGQFVTVNDDDPELISIVNSGGREAQIKAMKNPKPYDEETEKWYEWAQSELRNRGYKKITVDEDEEDDEDEEEQGSE
ncbi:MAG: hypothetical protein QXL94_04895 [Candidatus Parvarchaeum sp.]